MNALVIRAVALAAGLVVVAFVAVVVYLQLRSDDPKLATEAPQIPAANTPGGAAASPSAATPSPAGAATTASSSSNDLHFVVDPAQSSAKYVVKENLRGVPDTTTVGTTADSADRPDVTGDIYLTRQGLAAGHASSLKVDLRTLQTDQAQRDNFIRNNTLNTNTFPFAEFVITAVDGFPASYVENQQVQLNLTGTMTIHGVSKPVTWTVLARQAGDTLTATADTDFKMTDFGITPPSVPVAKADDNLHIQVVLVAKRAA